MTLLSLDWRDTLSEGDIIRSASGDLRVVRKASYWDKPYRNRPAGMLYGVYLLIRNCSWTGKCYTVINRSDLVSRKFEPTGLRWESDAAFKVLLEKEMGPNKPLALHCCDVKGIP